MLKDITLGQYYPGDSVIHKMDPRVKLLSTLLYIIALFLFDNGIGFALVTAFLIFVIAISKLPFSLMLKGIRAILVLIIITAACNLFFTQGENILFHWHFIKITDAVPEDKLNELNKVLNQSLKGTPLENLPTVISKAVSQQLSRFQDILDALVMSFNYEMKEKFTQKDREDGINLLGFFCYI